MNNKLNLLHKKLFECINAQEKNWNSFIYAQAKKFYQGFDEMRGPPSRNNFSIFSIMGRLFFEILLFSYGSFSRSYK